MRSKISGVAYVGLVAVCCTAVYGVSTAAEVASQSSQLEEIVVSGIRSSVQAAQDIKREASTVVESITLEDLGKFTDSSISDALQRVPGLNIERRASVNFGGAEGVSIRGLGPGFGSTTLNGRDVLGTPGFTGGGARQFDFSTMPPEVLTGVTVFKSATAGQVEPGLSGQIDFRTMRPLDYKPRSSEAWFGSLSAGASRDKNSKKNSPRISGIVGGKFLDQKLGFYVSGIYAKETIKKDELLGYVSPFSYGVTDANGNVTNYENSLTEWGSDHWLTETKYERRALAAGLQFKPNNNLDVNLDVNYNKFVGSKNDQVIYYQQTNIFSLAPGVNFGPGGAVIGGTKAGATYYDSSTLPAAAGANTGFSYISPFHLRDPNTNWNAGLNAVWKSDDERWKLGGDFSHSQFKYEIKWIRPYARNRGGESTFDGRGRYPVFTFTNAADDQITDPNAYLNQNLIEFSEFFQKFARSNRDSARVDLEFKPEVHSTVKVGARYSKTRYSFVSMNFKSSTGPTTLGNYFTGNTVQLPFMPFRTPETSFDGFCSANPQFCNQSNEGIGSAVGSFPTSVDGKPGDVMAFNPGESFEVRETNTAFYVQFDHEGVFGALKYAGNVGLRAVQIKEEAKAFQGTVHRIGFTSAPVVSSSLDLVKADNKYWEYLPSFNLTLMPRDNVNVRFGVAQTVSLPDYLSLAPKGTAEIIDPQPPLGFHEPNVANVGNTFLKPTKALNYDITGEYYTGYGGSYIVSVFYKDVKDQLTSVTQLQVPIPGQDPNVLFNLNSTFNASKGNTSGLELQTNQPLTFLASPWDGFGFQANYTYVDSKTDVAGTRTRFPGSSKNNFNLSAYYEKYGWAARIAYAYRSQYLQGLSPTDSQLVDATKQVDVSLSKKLTPWLELIATGNNITGANLFYRSEQGGYLSQYYERPRTYAIAVRASF